MSTRRYGFGTKHTAEISTLLLNPVYLSFGYSSVDLPPPYFLSQPPSITCSFTPEPSASTIYFAVNTCNPPLIITPTKSSIRSISYACIIGGILHLFSATFILLLTLSYLIAFGIHVAPPRSGRRSSCMWQFLDRLFLSFFSSQSSAPNCSIFERQRGVTGIGDLGRDLWGCNTRIGN
jgi:hypothetical protein